MKHIYLEENNEKIIPSLKNNDIDLGNGNIEIEVQYSSLNYKDMLAFNKNSKVIPKYPIIPGIDFSGKVIRSDNDNFKIGDYVLGTGFDLGIKHNGGLSEKLKVPAEWLVKIDHQYIKQSMIYGTAGLTAGLSIYQLTKFGLMDNLNTPILITGSTGGVGSIALCILKKLGFTNITAVIHNTQKVAILEKMGIHQFISSSDLEHSRPLQKQQYKYVIDTVGGDVLSGIIPCIYYDGCITTCGNAAGVTLNTTIFPFILRGIKLIGIDSVYIDQQLRQIIWNKLFTEWNVHEEIKINEISLDDVISFVTNEMKNGHHSGRTIVKIGK